MKIVAFEVEIGGINSIIDDMNSLKKAIKSTNEEFKDAKFGTDEYKKQNAQLAVLKNLQKDVRAETRKAGREAVIQADKGKNSYRAMNAELVNLRARFKDLSQADRNSTVGTNLIKQIGNLDGQLKRIDASIGLYQRNVGNYRQALIGIGDVVTGGLLTGGIQAVTAQIVNQYKEALRLIADFEKGLSSLSAITGLTGKDLDALGAKAVELSVKYSNTATDVLKAFQLIGSASPDLLKNADNLALVTEQVQILAKAGGIDLPVAADAVTKALNQFGLTAAESAQAVDILATSQQEGTATIAQLSESLKNVGSVARASNISFEQTNVLLQALAKGGLTGAEAGTKLRGVLLRLAQTGRDELNPATNDFRDILSTLESEINNVSDATTIFGAENAAAALTLIDQAGTVSKLAGNLNEYGAAAEQARINSDNLQGATAKFKVTYDALILNVEKGTGIFGNLARGIVDLGTKILKLADDISTGQLSTFEIFQGGADPIIQLSKSLEELQKKQDGATSELEKQTIELEKVKQSTQAFLDVNDQFFVSDERRKANLKTIQALNEKGAEIQKEIIRLSKEEQAEKAKLSDSGTADSIKEETDAIEKNTAAKKEAAQDDSLQKLNKEQSELSQLIKVGILDGIDYSDALEKWRANQLELNSVSEKFKEIQKALTSEVELAEFSVKSLSNNIKDLKTELSTASTGEIENITSELVKAEKELAAVQNQINDSRFNAENANASGVSQSGVEDAETDIKDQLEQDKILLATTIENAKELAEQDKILLATTIENAKELAEQDKILLATTIENAKELAEQRVILSLQADIEILKNRLTLWKSGTDEAEALEAQLAEKRVELQSNLDAGAFQSRVDEINELANIEIAANQRSALSDEEKAAKRKEIETQTSIDILNAELDLAETSKLRKSEIAKELADIEVEAEKEKNERIALLDDEKLQARFDQLEEVFGTLGSLVDAQEAILTANTEKQISEVNRRYQAEIDAAEGNAERQAEIEAERDAEIEEIERAAFERSKQIQKQQAIIAAAIGTLNILSAPTTLPDPFGAIFKGIRIAALVASTAAQISAIEAATFFEGGYTGKGFGQPDSTGAKRAGIVHQDEYVVPQSVLGTPEGQRLVDQLEEMRTGRAATGNGIMQSPIPQGIPNYAPRNSNISVNANTSLQEEEMDMFAKKVGEETGESVRKAMIEASKRQSRKERLQNRIR